MTALRDTATLTDVPQPPPSLAKPIRAIRSADDLAALRDALCRGTAACMDEVDAALARAQAALANAALVAENPRLGIADADFGPHTDGLVGAIERYRAWLSPQRERYGPIDADDVRPSDDARRDSPIQTEEGRALFARSQAHQARPSAAVPSDVLAAAGE